MGFGAQASYDCRVALNVRPVVPSRLFSHESKRSPKTIVGGYIALTKPRIIELLLVTTVPTMVLAAGKWPAWSLIAITLIGGTLAAGGANTINMYIDRDIDKLMKRTQNRPLVTGLIAPKNALVFAVILEVVAFAVLWAGANFLSAILALSATAFYVFIYSLWLKRTSKQNIVIGGAAGAMPTLIGWAAVTNSVGWPAVWLFIIMFLWTPPHFWALAIRHADEYRAANVPMLPVADLIWLGLNTTYSEAFAPSPSKRRAEFIVPAGLQPMAAASPGHVLFEPSVVEARWKHSASS